jgi:hypothetical protein
MIRDLLAALLAVIAERPMCRSPATHSRFYPAKNHAVSLEGEERVMYGPGTAYMLPGSKGPK